MHEGAQLSEPVEDEAGLPAEGAAGGPLQEPVEGTAEEPAEGAEPLGEHERSKEEGSEVDSEEEEADSRGPGPGADLSDSELKRRLAALLFASPEPLSVGRLVALLERPPAARVRIALEELGHALESAGLPIQVRGLRGGHTLMTEPEMGGVVARLAKGSSIERISGAALETLSIVAYRQPVTKAEIEAIRGVQAGPILRSLVDRGLVKVVGRADVPGHPLNYGTSKEFLERFGLLDLGELPRDAELARD